MSDFPHKCSRCGFCCLATSCKVALLTVEGAKENSPCPALMIDKEGVATCGVYDRTKAISRALSEYFSARLGFGQGCCTSATLFNSKTKEVFRFDAMPPEVKREVVAAARLGEVGVANLSGMESELNDFLKFLEELEKRSKNNEPSVNNEPTRPEGAGSSGKNSTTH